MSIPNLIPHKTLYISGYIYSYYAFVFIFEFPEHISKHILQFHTFFLLLITTNPAIQESNGNIKLVAMTYYKDTLQAFLDNHIHEILGKLGREFDSNDFITAFRLLFPNEYATALRRSSSYRAIHTWIARWYLSARTDLLQKSDIQSRESVNRNPTKNHTWIKL